MGRRQHRGALGTLAALCVLLSTAAAQGHSRTAPGTTCELLYNGEPVSVSSWGSNFNVGLQVGNLLDTTAPETVFFTLSMLDIRAAEVTSPSDYISVQFDWETSEIRLVVTDAFNTYEQDMVDSSNPGIFDIDLMFTCSDGQEQSYTLEFTVEDTNNHPPEFSSNDLSYTLPMPFPSGLDVSCLMGDIVVTDIDFSNTGITIQLDENGDELFTVQVSDLGSKRYSVQLFSKVAIDLEQTITFQMTAEDTGSPPLSSTASITINVDEETSLPTAPRFEEPAAHVTVAAEEIFGGNEIIALPIVEGFDQDITVQIVTYDEGDITPPKSAFQQQTTAGGSGQATVSLQWASSVSAEQIQDYKYALILIKASRNRGISADQTTTTVVHLSLPGSETPSSTACPTPEPTTTAEPCPVCQTTVTPTECPQVTTEQITECPPCPSTEAPTECPLCPSTEAPPDCPVCPSTEAPTECPPPDCPPTTPADCPPTVTPADCPSCSSLATPSSTDCPICPDCTATSDYPLATTNCPITDCSECPNSCASSSPPNDCPPCLTTWIPFPTTNCPITDCSECPNSNPPNTPATDCPPCSTWTPFPTTNCPITDCSQCPSSDPPNTPSSTGDPIDCSACPVSPPDCPSAPTECPPTDCPPSSPSDPGSCTPCDCSSTDCPPTDCPPSSPSDPGTCTPCDCSSTMCPPTDYPPSPPSDPGSCIPCDCSSTECPPTDCPPSSPSDPGNCTPCDCSSTECPPTDCPPSSPSDPGNCTPCECSSTECPPTECPPSSEGPPSSPSSDCPPCSSTPGSAGSPPTECPPCPGTDCPHTECPVDCDACPTSPQTPTTTELPPGPAIQFEQDRYATTVASGFTGTLLDLTLQQYDGEGYQLLCEVDSSSGDVASRLSVAATDSTTCRLTADVFLMAGSYAFAVVARLAGTSSSAKAEIALGVTPVVPCDDTGVAIFLSALQVFELEENLSGVQTLLLNVQLPESAQCTFQRWVSPDTYNDLVEVDAATGELSVQTLDYELVSSLVIDVFCAEARQLRVRRNTSRKDEPEWPKDLQFDTNAASVLLQILDVNDNAPVFGAGSRLVVCYPTGDLLERVQPGAVLTLSATDADEGLNAELRYSVDEAGARFFSVQAETGAVYLRSDAPPFDDDVTFSATATDMAGAADGRSASISVQVKPLSDDELVMTATVQGALPEDAQQVLADLAAVTGLSVGLLRAFPAPAPQDARSVPTARATDPAAAALTLLMYALDEQEQPISAGRFQELLTSSGTSLQWEVSEVSKLPTESEDNVTDITGYLAAVITLGVLVGLAILGGVLGYIFYLRPRLRTESRTTGYTEFASEEDKPSPLTSQVPLVLPTISTTAIPTISTTVDETVNPVSQTVVEDRAPPYSDSTEILVPVFDEDWSRKRSMTIRGGPDDYGESVEDGTPRRSESSDSLDGNADEIGAGTERRKSKITFNENVECIEVERL